MFKKNDFQVVERAWRFDLKTALALAHNSYVRIRIRPADGKQWKVEVE